MSLPGSVHSSYKYFHIIAGSIKKGRKTRVYMLVSKSNGGRLGLIKWYGAWRQYCFFPDTNTIWNTGCLTDIQDFLNVLKEERKK